MPGGSSSESLNLDPFASSVTAGPNTNTGGGGATDAGINSLLPDTGAVTYPVANPNTGITTTLGTGPDFIPQTQPPYETTAGGGQSNPNAPYETFNAGQGNTVTPDFGPDTDNMRIESSGSVPTETNYQDFINQHPDWYGNNDNIFTSDRGGYGFGGGGGDGCPAPWIPILLADQTTREAGSLEPGMQVWTQHEKTGEWGAFLITAVSLDYANRWKIELTNGNDFVGTSNHRVLTDKGWEEIQNLKPGAKLVQPEGFGIVTSAEETTPGAVVKITVHDAHTYVSSGFVSHNIKYVGDAFGGGGGSGVYDGYDMAAFARGGIASLPKSPGQKLLAAHRAGDMATVHRMLRKVRR